MLQHGKSGSSTSVGNGASGGSLRYSRPMDPREAAEYLRLDEKTITRWARKGYILAHSLGEGKRKFARFLEHELVDWLIASAGSEGQT